MPDDELNLEGIYDVPDDENLDKFGELIPPEVDTPPEEDKPAEEVDESIEQPTAEPDKREQTPEENARFAEMRRQKQIQEQIDREVQSRQQQSVEYQMAQLLAQQYGMPVDQLYTKMQEAVLQKQAQERGIPVEVLQQIESERKARQELETRLNRTEFDSWYREKQSEATTLKEQYKFLTDNDINGAISYMLSELGTTKMPLTQAVMALHGDRITAELRKQAEQEALAKISGRKSGPLPPQSSKASVSATLTAEERYVAKQMGISEDDYIKYRDMK